MLLDVWKDLYVPCFELVYPLLAPGGVIVADNMLHPPSTLPQAEAYRAAVRAKPDLEAVLLPIGHGLDVAVRKRESSTLAAASLRAPRALMPARGKRRSRARSVRIGLARDPPRISSVRVS